MLWCAKCEKDWRNTVISTVLCPTCGGQLLRSPDNQSDEILSVESPTGDSNRTSMNIRYATRLGATARDTLRSPAQGNPASPSAPKVRILAKDGQTTSQLPDYAMLEKLGEGGMGEVLAAQQLALDRVVAIKLLPEFGVSDREKEHFRYEALLASSLDHPNIVPIYDVGVDEHGREFFAMKKVQGAHWGARLREMTEGQSLEVLIRVCDAVSFAHSKGVIHRDLKPDNIMIGEFGEVLVMDWGLAIRLKDLRNESERFASGSPAYMAPEMVRADYQAIGTRSDVYLLGACLFESITGNAPHPGENVQSCLINALNNVIAPELKPGELPDIARKAMATDPEHRFTDVSQFQAALRSYCNHGESNKLCYGARIALAEAIRTGRHDLYARAIAGHEQALILWNENTSAHVGLLEARRRFAEHAMETGDLDLAASLVQTIGETMTIESDALNKKVSAAYHIRATMRRRVQRLKVTAVTTSLLVLLLAIGAAVLARRDRDEILATVRDRNNAELRLAAIERQIWTPVVTESFDDNRMPDVVHSLTGNWLVSDHRLIAQGPGLAAAEVRVMGSGPIRISFDLFDNAGVAVHLGATPADLPDHLGRSGTTVMFADNACEVRLGNRILARIPIMKGHRDLAQHFILEQRDSTLNVLIDGVRVIDNLNGTGATTPGQSSLVLSAQQGVGFDTLRVDRLAADTE